MRDLLTELEEIRTSGFGTVIEEFENGVSGIGVPVIGADGFALAGIAIAIPTHRFHTKELQDLAEHLQAGAKEITNRLIENIG